MSSTFSLSKNSTNDEIKEAAFQLLKKIRNVALATINKNKPSVRIVVIAYIKDDTIYFMTAHGKPMYRQLKKNPYISIVGKAEEDITVRVEGKVKFMEDNQFLLDLIKGHEGIYAEKTDILEMFYMESGNGEIFDLTKRAPRRLFFTFGDSKPKKKGYYVTDECNNCGICLDTCVTGALSKRDTFVIDSSRCLSCGRCAQKCPKKAIKFKE